MKVYVVIYSNDETEGIGGVFLSELGAEKAIEEYKKEDNANDDVFSYFYDVFEVQD